MKTTCRVLSALLVLMLCLGLFPAAHAEDTIPTPDQYRANCILSYSSYDTYVHGDFEWPFVTLARLLTANDEFVQAVALWKIGTFEMSDAYLNPFYESVIHDTIKQHYSESKIASTLDNVMKSMQASLLEKVIEADSHILLDTPVTSENAKQLLDAMRDCDEAAGMMDDIGDIQGLIEMCVDFEDAINKLSQARALQLMGSDLAIVFHDMAEMSSVPEQKQALEIMEGICNSTLDENQLRLLFAGRAALTTIVRESESMMWDAFLTSLGPFGTGLAIGKEYGKTATNYLFSTDDIIEHYFEAATLTDYEAALRAALIGYENEYRQNPTDENAKNFTSAYMFYLDLAAQGLDYVDKFLEAYYKGGVASAAWLTVFSGTNWENNYETMKRASKSIKSCVMVEQEIHSFETSYRHYMDEYFANSLQANPDYYAVPASMTDDELENNMTIAVISLEETADYEPLDYLNYEVYDDHVEITGYKRKPCFLTIPGIIEGKAVTVIGENAFSECKALRNISLPDTLETISARAFDGIGIVSLTVPEGVTEIGEEAFSSCEKLKSITIPGTVKTIGRSAFDYCRELEDVTMMEGIEAIGPYAFSYCYKLTSVELPNSISRMGGDIFDGCNNLETVNYPRGLVSVGGHSPFGGAGKLKRIEVPEGVTFLPEAAFSGEEIYVYTGSWNYYSGSTASIEEIILPSTLRNIPSRAFTESGITSITIPDGVSLIDYSAFEKCKALRTVNLPESVTHIDDSAFSGCANLSDVYYGGTAFQKEGVTIDEKNDSIVNCVWHCTEKPSLGTGSCGAEGDNVQWVLYDNGLFLIKGSGAMRDYSFSDEAPWYDKRESIKKVAVFSGITKIGKAAFDGCSAMNEVILPDSVEIIDELAFFNCGGLTDAALPENIKEIGNNAYAYCEGLKEVTFPTGTTTIGHYAFKNCPNLTKVNIPETVTFIGTGVFMDCEKLEGIWVDSSNPSYYHDKKGVLYSKDPAALVQVPGNYSGILVLPKSLTAVDVYAAAYCRKLTEVRIPDTVTTVGDCAFVDDFELKTVVMSNNLKSLGQSVFGSCKKLENITTLGKVTSIEGLTIHGCTSLKSITLPDTLTRISGMAFYCSGLEDIYIPDSVTYIGDSAFSGCKNLESIRIPEIVAEIEDLLFMDCTSLKSITIPESITSIPTGMFVNCKNLKSVTLPRTLTNVGYSAFENCPALTDVYFNGTPEQWAAITIGFGNDALKKAKVHYYVPDLVLPASLGEVGSEAFEGGAFTSVLVPEQVTVIGSRAFADCRNLTLIELQNAKTRIDPTAFAGVTDLTIIAPAGSTAEAFASAHGFTFQPAA